MVVRFGCPSQQQLYVMKFCVLETAKQLPVGNSECTPHVALVACAALALASQLF